MSGQKELSVKTLRSPLAFYFDIAIEYNIVLKLAVDGCADFKS